MFGDTPAAASVMSVSETGGTGRNLRQGKREQRACARELGPVAVENTELPVDEPLLEEFEELEERRESSDLLRRSGGTFCICEEVFPCSELQRERVEEGR